MKVLFLLCQLLYIPISAYSQQDSAIKGSWKVVSVFDGSIYINLKTDSVFITPEMKLNLPDTLNPQKIISTGKLAYGSTQFHFESKGLFRQTLDTVSIFSGQYIVNPSNNIIELTTDNSNGEKVTDKIIYKVADGLLYLSLKWDESKFDFVLERFD